MSVKQHSFAEPTALFETLERHVAQHTPPGALVCMPTGSTPGPLYQRVRDHAASRELWRTFRYLQLDEYLDAPAGTELFRETLERELLDPLGVPSSQRLTIPPLGAATPVEEIAATMNQTLVEHGPLDLVILGLGSNGHIAFNEPGENFAQEYHVVRLCETTLRRNFPQQEVHGVHALTISVPQICAARRICLVVPQREKQEILDQSLSSPESPQLPASPLQRHPALDVFRVLGNS